MLHPESYTTLPSDSASEAALKSYDAIIVGAGIAGSALAYTLSDPRRFKSSPKPPSVLLIERDLRQPDRIVGELLQPGGCLAVKRLGLRDCLDGIEAVEVNGYGVYWGTDASQVTQLQLPYPPESVPMAWSDGVLWSGKSPKGQPNRQQGRSFHHGRFVQRLRWKAKSRPNVTILQATVTDLVRCPQTNHVIGVTIRSSEDRLLSFFAPLTFIIDGCFSKFRRHIAPDGFKQPIVRSHFVGLLLETPSPLDSLPLPGHGHVILRKKKLDEKSGSNDEPGVGPVLVYQIGSAETRMLVDIPGPKVPSLSDGSLHSYLDRQVGPILPRCLLQTFQSTLDSPNPEHRLRVMPNSYLPSHLQDHHDGVILMGDSLNMRHPLTGGGMTVALLDVEILGNLLGQLESFDDWDSIKEKLAIWHQRRKCTSTCVNVLAQALYSLFGAEDDNLEILKEGCFKYFELGGKRVSEPISLLSALVPSPLLLFYHFFSVAFYAIYIYIINQSNPFKRPQKILQILWTACVTILPILWTES